MKIKQATNEEIFDLLICDALTIKWDNELDELQKKTDTHIFSVSAEKNINKIKRSIGTACAFRGAGKTVLKGFVLIFVFMGILFGGLLTQPEVYAAVGNVIRNIFETHDSYTYQGSSSEILFNKNIQLGFVPDGYELRSAFYSDCNVSLTYENADEMYIYFDYGSAENSMLSIDNERHSYTELNYDGTAYYFYEAAEEDFSTLIWYDDGYYYSIDAQLDKDTLIKTAQNIG